MLVVEIKKEDNQPITFHEVRQVVRIIEEDDEVPITVTLELKSGDIEVIKDVYAVRVF